MVSASPACTPQATLAEVMYWRRPSSVPAPSPRSALRSITAGETLEIALGRLEAGAQSVLPVRRGQISLRSEERRVGKECRSRWWEYRYKKSESGGVLSRRAAWVWAV